MTILKKIISKSEYQTLTAGRHLARMLRAGDVVALTGELGAGKTVFAKGILEGLGFASRNVFSASFVIAQEYKARIPVYHIDLYRLSPQEVEELDWDTYLDNQHLVLIEWAEKSEGLLTFDFKIYIQIENKTRKITIQEVRDVHTGN